MAYKLALLIFHSSSPSVQFPPPQLGCSTDSLACFWSVTFASTPMGITLGIGYRFGLLGDSIDIGASNDTWSGTTGSDSTMVGCGSFLTCDVSGFLISSVVEPASIEILLGELCIFYFAIGVSRRRLPFPKGQPNRVIFGRRHFAELATGRGLTTRI